MPKFFDFETQQEVSPQEAEALFRQGRLAIDGGGDTFVVDNQGQRYSTQDPEQLGRLLERGFRLETPEETERSAAVLEARDSTGLATGEAIARGVTLGLSDVVAGAVLGDEYSEGASLRRQELGPASGVIETAAGVVPALATGGSSLGARALASTPAGLLARGAGAAGAALERTLVGRGVGAGAARVLGMAAEGTLDGAVGGIGAALSEASLGNTEVTAENLLASGGLGALIGFGAGGLFSGAGLATGSVTRSIADRLRSEATGEVVERGAREAGFLRFVPDKAISLGSKATGIDEATLRRGFSDSSLRSDLLNLDQVTQSYNKRLRDDAQAMLDSSVHVRRLFAGDIKRTNLAADVLDDPAARMRAQVAAEEAIAPYRARIEQMHADGLLKASEFKRYTKELDYTLAKAREAFGETRKSGSHAADGFNALESLKRAADDRRKSFGMRGGGGDALAREAIPQLRQLNSDLGDSIRKVLEREDLFGAAGAKQAQRNAALSKALQTSKEFQDRLVRRTGESVEPDYWEVEKAIVDGDKADGFIRNLVNPNREYTNDMLKRHVSDMADMYETVMRNGDVPDELMDQFKAASEGARRMLKTINEAEERLGTLGKFKAAADAEQELASLTGSLAGAGAVAGFSVAGPIGAAVGGAAGKLAGAVTRPIGILRTAARIEALANRTRATTETVRSEVKSAVQRLAKPRADRRLASIPTRTVNRATAADRDEQRRRASNVEKQLQALKSDPMRLMDAVSYQTREMAADAPATTLAVAQQVARAVKFLESKLPPATQTPNLLQPGLNQRVWDTATLDKFSRYLDTISDPLEAVEDLKRGELSPEAVETLKAVYPNLYNEMRVAVAEELANKSDEMPYDSIIQLSLLMDLSGHPSLAPAYQSVLAEARDKQKKQAEAKTPTPSRQKPITIQPTLTDRLSGGLERR